MRRRRRRNKKWRRKKGRRRRRKRGQRKRKGKMKMRSVDARGREEITGSNKFERKGEVPEKGIKKEMHLTID